MDDVNSNRADVRDFLVTRRARITPQQAGLTFYGGNRRVPGLRREEVAMLAGVSADYYTRLRFSACVPFPSAVTTGSGVTGRRGWRSRCSGCGAGW